MSLQLVILSGDLADIETALGAILSECEVFPMRAARFGLSIPTKVLDALGEETVLRTLSSLEYFDLWAGRWNKPGSP